MVRYTFVNELGHLNAVGGGHTRRFQHDCAGVSPRPFGAEVQLPLNQPTVSPSGKVANNNISQLASQLANQLASGASHPPERCKWRQAKQELFKKKKKTTAFVNSDPACSAEHAFCRRITCLLTATEQNTGMHKNQKHIPRIHEQFC